MNLTAIVGGRVAPSHTAPLPNGVVIIEGGKIREVGDQNTPVPAGATVIEAAGRWVLPGFVEAHAHVGIDEESHGIPGDDTNETGTPNMAGVRALDAVDIQAEGFRDAVAAGITSVSVKPGSGNPIGGQTVALKTWGGQTIDDQVISASVSIKSAFGENPKFVWGGKNATPMTRLGIASTIRQAFSDARYYMAQKEAARDDAPVKPDLDLEALGRLLSGELLWDVHVHRHDDIVTALRIAEEFGLRLIVNHGTDAHLLAPLLASRHVPVAVGPLITSRSKQELTGHTIATAAILTRAGVKVAIITDHPVVPIDFLRLQARLAMREGLSHHDAIRAITVNPAEILGLDDRVGSLRKGRDADVVIWSGDPLDIASRALVVLIDGVVVFTQDADGRNARLTERFQSNLGAQS